MTYSQFDPAAQNRVPRNFGAKVGPKRPFNQKQIWAIRFFLDRETRQETINVRTEKEHTSSYCASRHNWESRSASLVISINWE